MTSWHTGMMLDDGLRVVLEESRRLGFLGERPVVDVVEHARAFVRALDGVDGVVADLGSGGGVPGLVIAHDRPDLAVVLIDRRAKRTDFLDRMVRRLRWTARVTVLCADVDQVIGARYDIDAAVARGFGPPARTLSMASRLVRPGGRIVISEPPDGERWPEKMLRDQGVFRVTGGSDQVATFERIVGERFT